MTRAFGRRSARYDAEIRKLDAHRGTASWDFAQLFLTKESLALMYQVMQLYGEALVQYEELEALMSFTPANIRDLLFHPRISKRRSRRVGTMSAAAARAQDADELKEDKAQSTAEASESTTPEGSVQQQQQAAGEQPEGTTPSSETSPSETLSNKRMETHTRFNMEDEPDTPLVENVDESGEARIKSLSIRTDKSSPVPSSQEGASPAEPSPTPLVQFPDPAAWEESLAWEDEGKRVLSYNMSDIRKRVFLQQCTLPELQRYLFARQCFFLFKLCRPAAVAEKGKTFVLETYKLLKVLYREVVSNSWGVLLHGYARADTLCFVV
jgi:hypothetical protein